MPPPNLPQLRQAVTTQAEAWEAAFRAGNQALLDIAEVRLQRLAAVVELIERLNLTRNTA